MSRSEADRFEIVDVVDGRRALVRRVLGALPEWFGIPASVDAYVEAVEALPMLAARTEAGELVGFLSLKRQTESAAEAYVLGVLPDWHGQGIGRALFAAEKRLGAEGVGFLTVKTIAPGAPDPFYDGTRAFYLAIGFRPIEVFPTLWDPGNPCLLMQKPLG